MSILATITFDDGKQKMIVTIKGKGTQMKSASIEAIPPAKVQYEANETPSIAEHLALQYLKHLVN